jgi:hypothetical protein
MSLRREREKAELRRLRAYEILLAAGATVLGAALVAAFALVVYSAVLSPRPAERPADPADVSTRAPEAPSRPPP